MSNTLFETFRPPLHREPREQNDTYHLRKRSGETIPPEVRRERVEIGNVDAGTVQLQKRPGRVLRSGVWRVLQIPERYQ